MPSDNHATPAPGLSWGTENGRLITIAGRHLYTIERIGRLARLTIAVSTERERPIVQRAFDSLDDAKGYAARWREAERSHAARHAS